MPYAPTERYQSDVLAQGFQQAGSALAEGIKRFGENKRQMDALEASAQMIASQHPDAIDPALLEKFSKGGLGQRQALVGQMTAAVAQKFQGQQLGIQQQNADTAKFSAETRAQQGNDSLSEGVRQFDTTHPADWSPSFELFSQTDENGVKSPTVAVTRNTPFSGQAQVVRDTEPAQPDGTIVRDAAGHEMGVYVGGKFVADKYVPQWQGRDQILVNSRTGQPKGGGETSAPAPGAPGTPGAAGAPAAYKSDQEVLAALKAGQLDRAAAKEILVKQFGYLP